jgi:DNA gyrase subunit B
MNNQLIELALQNAELIIRNETFDEELHRLSGDRLHQAVQMLNRMMELVAISERRGLVFTELLAMRSETGTLPCWRISWPSGVHVCWTEEEATAFIAEHGLVLDFTEASQASNGSPDQIATMRELHENREIDALITRLEEYNISINHWNLTQKEAVTGELLPTQFAWVADIGTDKETLVEVTNIPEIIESLRNLGRRNIEIKRFKGLGEMNPEELWDTTMDPAQRTLLKVTLDDADRAADLFSCLMGEEVEIRRTYIEDNALDVRNIDV